MSEPIRSKNGDMAKAPTPQNTPSLVTNSYLRSKPPTVLTINEEGEDGSGLGELANKTALLSMIQGKLGSLVGQQTGYIDSLPQQVKLRISGLKAVQQQHLRVEAEFQKELLELEKRFYKKFEPLYERRRKIVCGDEEPTAQEIAEGEALAEHDSGDEDDDPEEKETELADETADDGEIGIPNFWLTALENLSSVSETITDRDAEVLEYLSDIRMQYLETPGYELIFEFRENPFFSNKTLTKTYHYQAELGYSGDFVYDHADGCEISWHSKENNVTMTIERRKQRNRNTKQTRTIEKLTPTESFFNFFDPPKPPKKEEDDEEDEEAGGEEAEEDDGELEERLELDYHLGEEIKDRLIPRAVDWFTGDAVDFDYSNQFDDEEQEEGDAEEGSEEGSEDESGGSDEDGAKQSQPECKQQ